MRAIALRLFPLFLGLAFLLIVYVLPNGVVGRIEELRARVRRDG